MSLPAVLGLLTVRADSYENRDYQSRLGRIGVIPDHGKCHLRMTTFTADLAVKAVIVINEWLKGSSLA